MSSERPPASASVRRPSGVRSGPRSRRRGPLILGALLLLPVVAAVIFARPAYDVIRKWQAGNVLSQGQELARQQMYAEAIERLNVALQLDPDSVPALRAIAEIYTRFELPYALPAWRALLARPGHTEDDRRHYVELALKLHRFDLAEAELARMLASTNISRQSRVLASEFFHQQGDHARALQFAEDVLREDPDNPAHALRVARVLLSFPGTEPQQRGAELLASVRDVSGEDRIRALEVLSAAAAGAVPSVRPILAGIEPFPEPTATEFLLWADAQLRLRPQDREETLRRAIARLRHAPAADQAELCEWLNREGAHDRLLEIYTIEQAMISPPVLVNYLEALARAGRWQDLKDATVRSLPLEAWILDAFRAVAAERLGQDALAQEHWRRSFENVKGQSAKTRALGDLAQSLGAIPPAIRAYDDLTRDRLTRLVGYRRLAGLYERTGDTQRLRTLMREWSAHVPDDPVPENAYCYLSGLLRRDVEEAAQRATRLVERLPRRPNYRATLALLELRRDRPEEALRLYRRAALEPAAMSAQNRLVYAAVLHANGQSAEARTLVQGIDPSRLLPEERELFRLVVGPGDATVSGAGLQAPGPG